MTMPTSDGLHYAGCLCNDKCTCLDIECAHEQCICDRLSAAYQRGREAAYQRGREAAYRSGREDAANDMKTEWDKPVWEYDNNVKLIDRLLAAARGDGDE